MTDAIVSTQPARRAYRLASAEGGHRLQKFEEQVPKLGPRDVLVRIEAASLNYRDLLVLRGQLGPVREGLVPLSDGAGRVVATGGEVTLWREGDRVAPIFYRDWISGPYREAYGPSALGGGDSDGVLGSSRRPWS